MVCLRQEQKSALLRRLAQGHGLHARRIHVGKIGKGVVLRLQALGEQAFVRRLAQEALAGAFGQRLIAFRGRGPLLS